jgi:hypothetical protein
VDASYLRVKNWGELQHYSDRRPTWIKVYPRLLEDDAFARLDEMTQWQLVRVWFIASRSSALTLDEDGKQVPVVANDAESLQRSIQSLKKVPLARLIRDGWLIPVAEDELLWADEAKPRRPKRAAAATKQASERASRLASEPASGSLRGREGEGSEELQDQPGRQFASEGLPIENELLVARLMQRIGDHADSGTSHVIRSYASKLPPAALAKVIESFDIQAGRVRDRAEYAVGALRSELDERSNAA